MDEEKNAFNTMTKERVDRLMDLVTDSNTGYLLISGGGEIFLEPELIYQIVEKTSADITWLATSAFWAKNYISARSILKNIYNSYIKGIKNNYNKKIYIRVSVDSQHIKQISNSSCDKFLYLMNVIHIFENDYSQSENFLLQFHCIGGSEFQSADKRPTPRYSPRRRANATPGNPALLAPQEQQLRVRALTEL
ncbi:hypothetical protein [Desulfovibrio sp. 3_1_syn3]|uniref:hypothetical protein n=1 Tax=Desulfovibrio sp. 3_1_syn3 TaxID=457398 RepID=UPI0011C7F01F|nr:hypothetical protein [Desulfovibrio sp. 3_1_syn3]